MMKLGSFQILTTSIQPAIKPRKAANFALHQHHLHRKPRLHNTGKESDSETGLYYFGARYLDPKTGRWLSGDPALGEYLPSAPVSDEARKRNGNLPGMGGVFNYVNLHAYHYAGNNPVKYVDPDGEVWIDFIKRESGFNHDDPQGIFGYWDGYDYLAQMVFNIHATKFDLRGVTLRLWKGDYWGCAGGEIGLYNRFNRKMSRLELLLIGLESTKIEIFKKGSGNYVASREERFVSFWTTAFSWDIQANPEELYTVNTLTFKSERIAANFANNLRAVKIEAEEYPLNRNEIITIEQEGRNVIIKWGID